MTVSSDLNSRLGTRRRLFFKIEGVEPIFWQSIGKGVGDVGIFDPPGRHSVSPDCVAGYRMNETAATDDATDASGNGHTGTQTGSPTVQTGVLGGARGIASGDYFTVPQSAKFENQTFSYSAWVYWDGNTHDYSNIIMHYRDGSGNIGVQFSAFSNTARLYADLHFTDTSNITLTSAGAMTSSAWNHVGLTWDGTTAQLYLNGAPDGFNTASGKTVAYGADGIELGNFSSLDPAARYWRGYLDEIFIYNTVKPPTWFRDAHAGGTPFDRSAIVCLLPPTEMSVGLNIAEGVDEWGGITFNLIDVNDPSDVTKKYFGQLFAPARWDNNQHWRMSEFVGYNRNIDADAVSIPLGDVTGLPSSGTLYLFSEPFSYTSESLGTLFGVQKGLYPALGDDTYWGNTYRRQTSKDPSLGDRIPVGTVPFSMVGARVGLYEITYDRANARWASSGEEKLVWAGRISAGASYSPTSVDGIPGVWMVPCESLGQDLKNKNGYNMPSSTLRT